MMISSLFIVTDTGDLLIHYDYRNEIGIETAESAFKNLIKKVKSTSKSLLPENEHDGFWSYNVFRNSLYFVAVSLIKSCPISTVEMLSELCGNVRHFCGVVSEDTVRTNSTLIYEIFLEFMEFGYMQLSTPDKLRSLIHSEPIVPKCRPPIADGVQWGLFGLEKPAVQGDASNKPFFTSKTTSEQENEEIYVDVIEKLSVFIDKDGTVKRSEVNGKITMKNFISGGVEMTIGLNKDLNIVSRQFGQNRSGLGSSASLDHCQFHDSVNLDSFESSRLLQIQPSQGEIDLMTYQIHESQLATIPFRLQYEISRRSRDLRVHLVLKACTPYSSKALQVIARLRIPRSTTSLMSHLADSKQNAVLNADRNEVVWKIVDFAAGVEADAKLLLVDAIHPESVEFDLMELGPLVLEFELSSFLCSGLQINFMQVNDRRQRQQSTSVQRWVRYVTHSNSYVFLLG